MIGCIIIILIIFSYLFIVIKQNETVHKYTIDYLDIKVRTVFKYITSIENFELYCKYDIDRMMNALDTVDHYELYVFSPFHWIKSPIKDKEAFDFVLKTFKEIKTGERK